MIKRLRKYLLVFIISTFLFLYICTIKNSNNVHNTVNIRDVNMKNDLPKKPEITNSAGLKKSINESSQPPIKPNDSTKISPIVNQNKTVLDESKVQNKSVPTTASKDNPDKTKTDLKKDGPSIKPTVKTTEKIDVFACYKNNTWNELPDILQEKPTNKNIIIFHETSCRSREAGKIVLHQRQACSIESAALHNPNYEVYVLITTPTKIGNTTDFNDRLIKSLLKYKNIKFFYVNIDTYFEDTPVRELYHSGKIQKSKYHLTHLGDVMKFVNLWRFGAIYLDLDMIILKDLKDLPPNFTGYQGKHDMASGIMRFSNDEKGRKWVEMCLVDLNKTYKGWVWAYNANEILVRFLHNVCGTKNMTEWIPENCGGYKVYDPKEFYPIYYPSWRRYFYSQYFNGTIKDIENSTALHFWNHMTITTDVKVGTNTSALEFIAQKNCPQVYSELDKIF